MNKTKTTSLRVFLGVSLFLFYCKNTYSDSSSIQISPPPIAYPFFEVGRTDSKFEPAYVGIDAPNFSFTGGGANFDPRHVISEILAYDLQASFFLLNGQMPGVPPITPIPAYSGSTFLGYYAAIPVDNSKASLITLQIGFNLEIQPVHGSYGGVIFFFGPNLGMANMSISTPYNLYWAPTVTTYTGYTDHLTMLITTMGLQFGAQGDIALTEGVRIAPFWMMMGASGTASLTDQPNVKNVEGYSTSMDVPSVTSTNLGVDIIINNFSIGTMLQQIRDTSTSSSGDIKITTFRLGFNF